MDSKIYIASKTTHADKWIALRGSGLNIISTWIDEAGKGQSKDKADLVMRCIEESIACDLMIVYSEEEDVLRGAFIEMGVALSVKYKPVILVGPILTPKSAFTYLPQVFISQTIEHALWFIKTSNF